jgi:hypothetical protein
VYRQCSGGNNGGGEPVQRSTYCGRGYHPVGGFRGWGVPFRDHIKRHPICGWGLTALQIFHFTIHFTCSRIVLSSNVFLSYAMDLHPIAGHSYPLMPLNFTLYSKLGWYKTMAFFYPRLFHTDTTNFREAAK